MGNAVSTIIKSSTVGYEKAAAALSGIGKAGGLVGKTFAVMATSLGTMGGALGKAASQAANFLFAIQNMGAIGGIIAGAQIVITNVCNRIVESYNKMAEAAARAGERIRERLSRRIVKDMGEVAKALDAATTQAQRQAKHLEGLANAYLKVASAKDAAAKAGDDAQASALSLERSQKMAAAATPEEKARIGVEYDVRIAREAVAATQRQQDEAVAASAREADEKARQAKRAAKDEKLAERTMKKATAEYERYAGSGASGLVVSAFEAKKKAAEAAYEEAVSNRVSKQADSDAAEEGLKAALSARKASLDNARKTLVEAEASERELHRAQKEAAAATITKAKAELEAVRAENRKAAEDRLTGAKAALPSRSDALQSAAGEYRARFAEHFELWRDPEAAQRAQDAAKEKTVDLKRFRKDADRYGGKWRIDEAARLMREGDEDGLQDRLAEWRKSSKFSGQTEQMVLAAAAKQNENAAQKSLDDIRATSASIDQKLEAIKAAFEGSGE